MSTIFDDVVLAGADDQNVELSEFVDCGLDQLVAIGFRIRPDRDALDLGAERFAFGRGLLQFVRLAGGNHEIGAGTGQHLRGKRAERPGRTGDDRGLALDVEQGERIFQKCFGHVFLPRISFPFRSSPGKPFEDGVASLGYDPAIHLFAKSWMPGQARA